jgi:hypothetical protein
VDTASPTPTLVSQRQAPTPTPVPPEARQTALEFARRYQAIDQDWESFHADFDQWRAGLVSCDQNSVQTALQGFAVDFDQIAQQARNLPRSSATRDLADQLIKAAENEATALRQLRVNWQPGNTTVFSAVETARTGAATAQQEVLDKLIDSRESTAPESVDEAQEFSDAFRPIYDDWEQFQGSYNSLRDQRESLTSTDISSRLSGLVDEFNSIVSAVNALPETDSTRSMAENLRVAAEAENTALKELRDEFQGQAGTTPGGAGPESPTGGATATPAPTPPATTPAAPATPAPTPSTDADPFARMNDLVARSDTAREQVKTRLESIMEDDSAQEVADIDNFRQQYDSLTREWDEFHRNYDQWRRNEGGCNRTEVINRLGQFSVRFGELASRVRALPQASLVRPMGDTLVEAVEREEGALRVLRNTWRPFATDVYIALDQERTNADSLRRSAEAGIQEMLSRLEIPASEL